jgi:hypothetical protein
MKISLKITVLRNSSKTFLNNTCFDIYNQFIYNITAIKVEIIILNLTNFQTTVLGIF